MKYWLLPVLLCAGAAQAHAQVITVIAGPTTVTSGVNLGPNNTNNIHQHNAINVVAVENVTVGPKATNHNNVSQTGHINYSYLGNLAVGVPMVGMAP